MDKYTQKQITEMAKKLATDRGYLYRNWNVAYTAEGIVEIHVQVAFADKKPAGYLTLSWPITIQFREAT